MNGMLLCNACILASYLVLTAAAQSPPAPRTAVQRTVDVRIKVSVNGKGRLPPKTRVEISGQDALCGQLNSRDAIAALDENGEALFKGLPVCKVSIKINTRLFMPVRKLYDLANYKAPIAITMDPMK